MLIQNKKGYGSLVSVLLGVAILGTIIVPASGAIIGINQKLGDLNKNFSQTSKIIPVIQQEFRL